MSLLPQVCFIAIFLFLKVNGDKSSPTCAKPYDKMMACNLICNMIQDSDANNAMKMLQTKLESLITAIKKPPPQPGKQLQSSTGFQVVQLITAFSRRIPDRNKWKRFSNINQFCSFQPSQPLHASNSTKNTSKVVFIL